MGRSDFNVNGPAVGNGNYFGLPHTVDESELIIVSVPWEVTVSYGGGASAAPGAIIDASLQIDLYDVHNPGGWQRGIGTVPVEETILKNNKRLKEEARKIIRHLESGGMRDDKSVVLKLKEINEASGRLNDYVYNESKRWLDLGKTVAVVGGDHSVPLGLMKAVAGKYPGVGILHIDAHADLRREYEGFTYSHASVMYNALTRNSTIGSLTQVAIRDFCDDEVEFYKNDERIYVFTDHSLHVRRMKGEPWDKTCDDIVNGLPENVYISFDIDGLSPDNCPNTGTPVPGGLSYNEAVHLISKVVESGRRIVGFDLCEVSPGGAGDWDANVGARVLYKLCNLTLKSKYAG